MLIILLATTGCLLCLFPIFSNWLEIVHHVLSPFENCLWLNFRKFFSNCLAICTHTLFCSSVNRWGIHLAEIFFYFQDMLQNECTLDRGMPTALVISQTLYLPSLSMISLIFEKFFLHVELQNVLVLHL